MKAFSFAMLCFVVLLAGCDLAEPKPRKESGSGTTPLVESMTGMGVMEEMQSGGRSDGSSQSPASEQPAEPKTETVEIERGFTGKGQYGQAGGEKPSDMITVPVGELFAVRERMFLMQLKQAEDLYKASNDNQMPKTQEDYMEKIVGANMLKLPDLPAGQEYVYDSEAEQLKIKKPK